ncbi:uncharacterized protein WM277_001350 isoform 1-T1 [Molossus nigricans]
MPRHKNLKYLLTMVDTFSGWIEAFPTTSETAGTVADHLVRDIIPRFGLPTSIQSDNGPAFISKVTEAVSTSLDIQWKLHAAYHPQSSGPIRTAHTDNRGPPNDATTLPAFDQSPELGPHRLGTPPLTPPPSSRK